jgi:isopenicillin N synthase-like dioxygenase
MGSIGLPTTHYLYPPFPDNITTAPLVTISLAKLEAGDENESKAFFEATKNLGFFYMKLEGSSLGERIVDEAEQLHKMQQQFFKQPNEEKEIYAREKIDPFFGYRVALQEVKDEEGRKKRNETYNVSLHRVACQNDG